MPDLPPRSAFPDTRAWLRALPSLPGDPAVDPGQIPTQPSVLFLRWLEEAVAAGEPNPQTTVLSTATSTGDVDARVLTLKDVDEHGWWFSGATDSPKGRQLAENPAAALTFHWPGRGRQVRVRGRVEAGSAEISARDYLERSATARAVAAASRQSEPLTDEAEYDRAVAAAGARIEADPDFVARGWQAWCLVPDSVEFWLADPGRRHQRWRYRRAAPTGWSTETLWP
ncbi:pyridoxal 5'-phosphate synthase [Rhodococcus spelaei]|uniref:Pyridoxal 5'-phosphate synthase n=1 Tax=Rhodococcus spelaei TaxID=2546320 RepID=A0A541BNS0_9NOCA|nr:pyridoxal 5'-phosphate synthase [Rhodococcus spelaei]TQF73985.1 pyridoxal 5'-phosphate synthase [Rhodococcus spelaei]